MVTILKKYWFGMSTEELKELNIKLELLETRQAFHEDTIESLNTVIIQQQKDIEHLELKFNILQEQLKQAADTPSEFQQEEPPPPHY